MPENGDRETRIDRIERALELLIADHEQFRPDHKQLLIAQIVQQDEPRKLIGHGQGVDRRIDELRQHGREVEWRIDKLVSGIGEFMRRPQVACLAAQLQHSHDGTPHSRYRHR